MKAIGRTSLKLKHSDPDLRQRRFGRWGDPAAAVVVAIGGGGAVVDVVIVLLAVCPEGDVHAHLVTGQAAWTRQSRRPVEPRSADTESWLRESAASSALESFPSPEDGPCPARR